MEHISSKVIEQFVENALFEALEKVINHETEMLMRFESSPFGRTPNTKSTQEDRFIAKGKKGPTSNKILNFEIVVEEKHVLVHREVNIKWIKSKEQLNHIEHEPKLVWWFGKKNFALKDDLLNLLGEFRTFEISEDVNPKVTFYIQNKKQLFK
jgi:hypothetical protein